MWVGGPFGWVASIMSIITFLFPIMPFVNVVKGKLDFENTPSLLVFTGYCNCVAWYFYGYFYENLTIKFCNIVGLIIYLLLIIIYLAYETKKYLLDSILNALIVFNGTWAAHRALSGALTELNILENICFITTCACCIYPLFLIYKVIRVKNYNVIPEITVIGSIISEICWVVSGLINDNHFFVKCHIVRIFVSIAEISISVIYKKQFPTPGQIHDSGTLDIEVAGTDDASNKNLDTVVVRMDADAEEIEKIKEKPAIALSKSGGKK